jgi:ribulose 1,5-bisphosphate synthetase/thiazole synthase
MSACRQSWVLFPIKDNEHIVSYLNVLVVIIGAGIVGAATAYYLSNNDCGAGTSITILDAVGPEPVHS